MTIIDDAFLETQAPLILQFEIGPERTLLLVSEFVCVASSTLEEAEVYPNAEIAKRKANDPGCCVGAECDQLSASIGIDTESEVREEGKSKKGLNEIVWLLKLYEKRYKEVILRERVASVKELSPPVLQALARACSTTYPIGLEKPEIRLFFMGRQPYTEFQVKLVNRTLCIIIREDTAGAIEDFVANAVSSTSKHAEDMTRYSAERDRLLRSYKGPTRPQMSDLIHLLESSLKESSELHKGDETTKQQLERVDYTQQQDKQQVPEADNFESC